MPSSGQPKHTQSLANELIAGDLARPKHRKRKSLHDEDENAGDRERGYVDAKASRKILKLGQDLAAEEEDLLQESAIKANKQRAAFGFRAPVADDLEDGTEDDDPSKYDNEEAWEEEGEIEDVEVDPEDLAAFNKFLPSGGEEPSFDVSLDGLQRKAADNGNTPADEEQEEEGTDLASLILQKIAEHEAAGGAEAKGSRAAAGEELEDVPEIPEKVLEVFRQIGGILSRYKSGKLPKPVKILPSLPHWRELLLASQPERWSSNAVYAVTRIFASSRPQIVQEYYENVLLPAVRENIHESDRNRLNVHIYKALEKATYKPAGFFKGIVFPLIESGTCTLREADIVSSIVTRASIPPLHAGAAMLRLTDIAAEQASSLGTENSGATNIFLRKFLEKGYALPYKVVDNLVFHFLRFRAVTATSGSDAMAGITGQGNIEGKLPVLWHRCLLTFAQRYRNDITEDQREALLDLLQERGHRGIGPEVRRELLAGRGRGVVVPEARFDNGGDDTMMEMDSIAA